MYLDFDCDHPVGQIIEFWDLDLELAAFAVNGQRFRRDENVSSVKHNSVLNVKKLIEVIFFSNKQTNFSIPDSLSIYLGLYKAKIRLHYRY